MRFAYRMFLAVLVLSALGSAMPAAAQKLDTPIVRLVENSHASITVEIEAGASGAPAGFVVEWMKKSDYDALGGNWPADEYDSRVVYCEFFGQPTWNVSTGSYLLGPGGVVQVELGDVFDETGVYANYYDELIDFQNYAAPQTYVLRVHAEGTGYEDESDRSATYEASTKPAAENCTFTIGYWKTHPEVWPVSSLTLGTVNYTAAELLSILLQPSGGNGLIVLAHQLIAAKLNIAGGADPTPVAGTIAAADAQIGGLVVPPVGAGYLSPASTSGNATILDNYNNGNLGVPHCGEVPAEVQTWGKIKAGYR